jgi:hypothetical protein
VEVKMAMVPGLGLAEQVRKTIEQFRKRMGVGGRGLGVGAMFASPTRTPSRRMPTRMPPMSAAPTRQTISIQPAQRVGVPGETYDMSQKILVPGEKYDFSYKSRRVGAPGERYDFTY